MKLKLIFTILIINLLSFFSFSQEELKFDSINTFYNYYGDYHSHIYAQPNISSLIKGRFHSFSRGYFKYIGKSKHWFKVKYLNNEVFETGYVLRSKLYEKRFFTDNSLFFIDYNSRVFTLKKYKEDKVYDSLQGMNLHHGERVRETKYSSGLKNITKMICFQTYRESCPGLTSNNYIISTKNNKLKLLVTETSTGEAGWNSHEEVYLPIKFGDGTIRLINYDYEGEIIDYNTGKIREFKNSKQFNIPISQLILKIKTETEPVLDKNHNPILDKNKEEKLISHKKLEVWRWNGAELKLIKTKILLK